jgi:hypothetical protein
MYLFSIQHGIQYWYAAMEWSLALILSRMGFTFNQIGLALNYYGSVSLYMLDLRQTESNLSPQPISFTQAS